MIFNTNVFAASMLSDSDFVTILIVKDKCYDALEERHTDCQNLMARGWLDAVKAKKNQPEYECFRLSKKAKDFLRDLEIPGITEEVKAIGTKLIDLYEAQGLGDKIGNKRKVMRDVAWFEAETNTGEEIIVSAVETYIYSQDKTYVKKLENLIHQLPNAFATRYQLENSYLYTLIKK